jgi:aryl-alcohol dehydrogenase-like predicted oxidoreductase
MDGPGEKGLVPGRATCEGTARFALRFAHLPGHFRRPDRLSLSSIALGTRQGQPGGVDDLLYRSSAARCLELGVNVFNTALSDRMQTSERALGTALERAFREGLASRDEVVVVSKGGVLVPDPDRVETYGDAQRDLLRSYVDTGLLDPSRVVNGHSIDPAFLRDQIERSRRNLRLGTIDLYLLQEPELHLYRDGATDFRARMIEALRTLEDAVRENAIAAYGLCSWDGLLLPHSERGHLSIVDLFEMALEVGGGDHHLRAVQLPYGLAMGEGATSASQLGPDGRVAALFETMRETGTAVMVSAPLYGGKVIGKIPDFVREAFPEAQSDAQRALQFARSTAHVTTAVVGMRQLEHVEENLALAAHPPADPSLPARLFRSAAQQANGLT